ncbi:thioredoxin domain-containing protein [Myxococcota bacterium]|nr:thioredoxin domain-containing protein [Myxococcota bacterium]MBU1510262.1 thioredoxin domain-containing protein [Myxococcota bacterium]
MKSFVSILLSLTFVAAFACERMPKEKKGAPAPAEGQTTAPKEAAGPKPLKVEFYVMSQCPYGVEVENAVKPVLDKIGNLIDFKLDYIVNPLPDGSFKSLHGQPEVDGNIVQLCANKYAPEKFWAFLGCQNKNMRDVHNNWKACAEQNGLDVAKLQACKDGQEGKDLLKASGERAQAAKAGGSPTIVVNGKPYAGGRSTNGFMRAFCEQLPAPKPAPCADIKPPPVVNIVFVTDSRCKECAKFERGLEQVKRMVAGAVVKKVDYTTEEGKKIYDEAKLTMLPALLADENLKKDEEAYPRLARFATPAGSWLMLKAFPQVFDPKGEICDNTTDDNGDNLIDCADPTCRFNAACMEVCDNKIDDNKNGKIDCDEPDCTFDFACRKEVPNTLELFVMSQCPYGVKAFDAMKEVLKNFGNKIDFKVYFIADKVGTGFNALHGQPEVDENIRELCAMKNYAKDFKYMEYIWCRNPQIHNPDWKGCAKDGIDPAVIEACFNGEEGKKLLEDSLLVAKMSKVGGSPTWIANGKNKFSGIDAETVKTEFCKYNDKVYAAECKNTLTKNTQMPAGGGCGAK